MDSTGVAAELEGLQEVGKGPGNSNIVGNYGGGGRRGEGGVREL